MVDEEPAPFEADQIVKAARHKRENVAHVRQPKPDSCSQVKVVQTFCRYAVVDKEAAPFEADLVKAAQPLPAECGT